MMKSPTGNIVSTKDQSTARIKRLRIRLEGFVQGLGFRPFVYRLAHKYGLSGWVVNSVRGVEIEIEGRSVSVERFLEDLETKKPPLSRISNRNVETISATNESGFSVRKSETRGDKSALILPDIAICPECLNEIRDPNNRRYRYPFTNCTYCGPRYSIIEAIPYDRANTTMRKFRMCPECREEYNDPNDRRFHAQPNACPVCGPKLALLDRKGNTLSVCDDALKAAAEAVRRGEIVALKGLGGFQLLVDARNEMAVRELRKRKRRPFKPLAVMFPGVDEVEADCLVSLHERELLTSVQSPIVLLRKNPDPSSTHSIARAVAPENQYLGAMFPYTPLHILLMDDLGFPIVATSGNLTDEPICIDEEDALKRLRDIADCFLVHDRGIVRPIDDSVARVVDGSPQVLRAARGYSPLILDLRNGNGNILAVGAHQKNNIAIARDKKVFVSQHLGDQDNALARLLFRDTIDTFLEMYDITPERVVTDLHPAYAPSEYAESLEVPLEVQQHHFCHIAACIAENEIELPCLGIIWDGTGLGPDGTIWGGEFLLIDDNGWRRIGHLRNFLLPGGDKAVRDTRRSGIGLLYGIYGDRIFTMNRVLTRFDFSSAELTALTKILPARLNCSVTSSAGRLFDAVAAILGICRENSFEGQAGMMLESRAILNPSAETYPIGIAEKDNCHTLDYSIMIKDMICDIASGNDIDAIPSKFHNSLVYGIVEMANRIGVERIALSGGCFQNGVLQERTLCELSRNGFEVYVHHRVPPNDGGISFGQAVAAIEYTNRG